MYSNIYYISLYPVTLQEYVILAIKQNQDFFTVYFNNNILHCCVPFYLLFAFILVHGQKKVSWVGITVSKWFMLSFVGEPAL